MDNKNKFELFSDEELDFLLLSVEKCNNCYLSDRYIQLAYQLKDEINNELKKRRFNKIKESD